MENKAIHYDGSMQMKEERDDHLDTMDNEINELNDEIRKNIGGNPYFIDNKK